jgi:uncharacterized protein
MNALKQFSKKQYLNLETFRKSGEGVKTPVWFAQADETLYVMTKPTSGKAKRIRNNGRVRVVPCKMDGTVTGEWVSAQARQLSGDDCEDLEKLFDKKYGLLKKLFGMQASQKAEPDIIIEVKLLE